ncbi:MAG: hypothetical protein R3F59_16965 [Myxococcota bacterium]
MAPAAPPPPPRVVHPLPGSALPKAPPDPRSWAERAPYNLGAHLDAESR